MPANAKAVNSAQSFSWGLKGGKINEDDVSMIAGELPAVRSTKRNFLSPASAGGR